MYLWGSVQLNLYFRRLYGEAKCSVGACLSGSYWCKLAPNRQPEEGKELIDGVVMVLEKIRPQLKKWWFRVMLDGIKVSLMELKEHLEEIEE